MKTVRRFLAVMLGLLLAGASGQEVAGDAADTGGSLVIEARGFRDTPPPLFFSARAESSVKVGEKGWEQQSKVVFKVVQGKAKVFSLKLSGEGEVVGVEGESVRDWAVRSGGDGRFLEIRPVDGAGGEVVATVVSKRVWDPIPAEAGVLTLGTGSAVGFSSLVEVEADRSVDVNIARTEGLIPVGQGEEVRGKWMFQAYRDNSLVLALKRGGAAPAAVEMRDVRLEGTVDEARKSVAFVLTGTATVRDAGGGSIGVLSGFAGASSLPVDEAYELKLKKGGAAGVSYELAFVDAGEFPVRLEFRAGLREQEGRYGVDFWAPAGAVVPVGFSGLEGDVAFDANAAVFPTRSAGKWVGFLPSDGRCEAWWTKGRDAEEGKLFFTSDAVDEVRVGAGLVRQGTRLELKLLQGKLESVRILMEGNGEILAVEGENVSGWAMVAPDGGGRAIDVRLARAATESEVLIVRSQAALGEFPLAVEPLRLSPEGAVRHSGHVRVANEGAVRLELSGVAGMTQLAPEQFPVSEAAEGARQVFVYRYPAAARGYTVNADQVLPEVGVSQILIYEMTESDRVIRGQVELDIREAPLREWTMMVPEEFAVVSVSGAEVSDYVVGSDISDGKRGLKVLFGRAVDGRQLVEFRLERNTSAVAGVWTLPVLDYPGAKSVRGHVGAASAPGYRMTPGATANLAEVPLAYFPARVAGLQQTFRLREAEWSAEVLVEALEQSIQVDVFHLYSLKEGIAYGSVLLNYFVVGAPVSEWRLEVPEVVGNVAVDGQNVQGWRREGEELIVSLHQPVLGAATLLLSFEQPMSARGGALKPGEVKPVGVQGERGTIQVVSPSQVKYTIESTSEGLLKIEPLELPAEFRVLTSAPTLVAYQYPGRPAELSMNVEWYEPGETVEQVVDFAKLNSQVSGDGQVVTDAVFYVKTRGTKALRLKLEKGVELWEARVDGAPVNARTDGDETLVPLAANLDPNTPVEVTVRLGQRAVDPRSVRLVAPAVLAPALIATWTVTGDPGRRLLPVGSATPELARQVRTETGFEWLMLRGWPRAALLGVLVFAGLVLCRRGGFGKAVGMICVLLAVLGSVVLAAEAGDERRVNAATLEFVAPVVGVGQPVTIGLKNVAMWEAMVSWPGAVLVLIGLWLIAAVRLWKVPCGEELTKGLPGGLSEGGGRFLFCALGWLLLSAGLLLQRGGAVLFFVVMAIFLLVVVFVPLVRGAGANWKVKRRNRVVSGIASEEPPAIPEETELAAEEVEQQVEDKEGVEEEPKAKKAKKVAKKKGGRGGGATSILLALGGLPGLYGVTGEAQGAELMADRTEQRIEIRGGRLYGEVNFQLTADEGETLVILNAPAVLTKFSGEGLRIGKRDEGGKTSYQVATEVGGVLTGVLGYELALGDPAAGFVLPTARAAVQQVEVKYDKAGWEFSTSGAILNEPLAGLGAGESGARLAVGPVGPHKIVATPKGRDVTAEKAEYFVEVSNLFIPGAGYVDGRHRVTVRPSKGQVGELLCDVPEGFTVSDVSGEKVGGWRFDPENGTLRIEFNPAFAGAHGILIGTQKGSGALPAEVVLKPLKVRGAVGQVGMAAIGFGSDAQPERVIGEGMSKVNLEDFDQGLGGSENGVTLHEAYRYGENGGTLTVGVGEVSPEVRVVTRQTLSIGEERMVLAVDLAATITRAGLFKLSFPLAEGLEIESVSGGVLSHWTESVQEGERIVTLHLNGRTLGEPSMAVSITGPAPGEQEGWDVPKFLVREATRQTGQLLVVPDQGIRVRAVARSHVSQLDARKISGNRAGTLAFRLLQEDWALQLGLEALDPWVTAQLLQEVTVREGLTRTHLKVAYRIENAAVKAVRVRLPGLTEAEVKTVRASGDAVKEIVVVDGDPGLWEVRFQRRVLGNVVLDIDYQRAAKREGNVESVSPVELDGVRQAAHWVAVRVSGQLESKVGELTRGWQMSDWSGVPRELVDPRDRSVPALVFRVVEPEGGVQVTVQRHAVAEALRLRVSNGELTTVFSAKGDSVTEAKLAVDVVEKSALRVRLPTKAQLFSAQVNGQSAGIVREGQAYLFYVLPREDGGQANVALTWSVPGSGAGNGRVGLAGPRLNIPLQNISWRVVLPEGYELADVDGSLDLADTGEVKRYQLEDYQRASAEQRSAVYDDATKLMESANRWKSEGQQDKARSALSRLSKAQSLDEAANEDARVQLRELQTEQAIVGLNTRRQKMYFDNRADDAGIERNEQLEQAADRNPLFQGETNYNPQEIDGLLLGNTDEENSALKRIAARLVSQQLAAEPARKAIDVTLPEHGEVVTFRRSVQVNGEAPLELDLRVVRERQVGWPVIAGLLLAIAALSWCGVRTGFRAA